MGPPQGPAAKKDWPQQMVRPVCHVNLFQGCSFRHYSFASRPFDRFANRMNLRRHVKAPLRKCHQVKGIITHISTFVKHKSTIFPSFSCAFCLFFNCQVLGHPPAFWAAPPSQLVYRCPNLFPYLPLWSGAWIWWISAIVRSASVPQRYGFRRSATP